LQGFGHGRWHEPRLVATGFALVAGMAIAVTVTADIRAAAFGANVYCRDHNLRYVNHLRLDHHRRF
jgi:hypothetical protein